MKLCVIPARGGSKRIPRKKPMIAWSIEAAQRSDCFDKIIVSTDDQEIALIASENGAEVPFLRPDHLSNDHAGTHDVIQHAIFKMADLGHTFEFVCCLYATAPFALSSDINLALDLLQRSRDSIFVFTATSFPFPIQRGVRIDSDGYSSVLDPVSASLRSQDLEDCYHDAGQFYWASSSTWSNSPNIFDNGRPLILPRWRVQDIDTPEDWKRAEYMHLALMQELIDV